MIDEGHIIGNHTVNHKSMPALSENELNKELMNLHTAIYEKFGYEMKYMRPPKGEYSEKSLSITTNVYVTLVRKIFLQNWLKHLRQLGLLVQTKFKRRGEKKWQLLMVHQSVE
jgi:peptidoglycan-N-acetylmuramic acid deacetylase